MSDLERANDLLRSAYQVAQRQGNSTNWSAFEARLKEFLCEQAGADQADHQQVLRATCTPKTFRIVE